MAASSPTILLPPLYRSPPGHMTLQTHRGQSRRILRQLQARIQMVAITRFSEPPKELVYLSPTSAAAFISEVI
jgi:hypothetical protein